MIMAATGHAYHIVNVEVVHRLGALNPLHNVACRQVREGIRISRAISNPGWERPRQSVQLDVGVALLGLLHQPPEDGVTIEVAGLLARQATRSRGHSSDH